MHTDSALEGGVVGATVLTILHEVIRHFDEEAPRMDKLGMQAFGKFLQSIDLKVPEKDQLFIITTLFELLANTLFYGMAGAGGKHHAWQRGALLGLAAGIGAVALPEHLGLVESANSKKPRTKLMTIGMYLIGGIVTAEVSRRLEERRSRA